MWLVRFSRLVICVLVLGVTAVVLAQPPVPRAAHRSLYVLPFAAAEEDADAQALGVGLAQAMRTQLMELPKLHTSPLWADVAEAMRLWPVPEQATVPASREQAQAVLEQLHLDAVVFGQVSRQGAEYLVQAQLLSRDQAQPAVTSLTIPAAGSTYQVPNVCAWVLEQVGLDPAFADQVGGMAPPDVESILALGQAALAPALEQRLAILEPAYALAPRCLALGAALATAYLQAEHHDFALHIARYLSNQQGGGWLSGYLLAEVQAARGDAQQADASLGAWLQAYPESHLTQRLAAELLARRKLWDRCWEQCESLLRLDPRLPHFLTSAAALYLEGAQDIRGDLLRTELTFDQMAAYDHGMQWARRVAQQAVDLSPDYLKPRLVLLATLDRSGWYFEAEAVFEEIVERDPGNPAAFEEGHVLVMGADEFAARAAAAPARTAEAHHLLGELAAARIAENEDISPKVIADALEHFQAAIALGGADEGALHAHAADLLLRLDRPQEAWPHVQRALELGKEASGRLVLGRYYQASGELEKAEEALIRATVHAPENGFIQLSLGRVRAQRQDFQGAERALLTTWDLLGVQNMLPARELARMYYQQRRWGDCLWALSTYEAFGDGTFALTGAQEAQVLTALGAPTAAALAQAGHSLGDFSLPSLEHMPQPPGRAIAVFALRPEDQADAEGRALGVAVGVLLRNRLLEVPDFDRSPRLSDLEPLPEFGGAPTISAAALEPEQVRSVLRKSNCQAGVTGSLRRQGAQWHLTFQVATADGQGETQLELTATAETLGVEVPKLVPALAQALGGSVPEELAGALTAAATRQPEALLALGQAYLVSRFQEAEPELQKAAGDPRFYDGQLAFCSWAEYWRRLPQRQQALGRLQVLHPDWRATLQQRVSVLLEGREYLAVQRAGREALARWPQSSWVQRLLCDLHYQMSRHLAGAARASLRNLLICTDYDPRAAWPWLSAAFRELEVPDVERPETLPEQMATADIPAGGAEKLALAACRRATELAPENPRAWSQLAHLLSHAGAPKEEVRQAVDRAVALNPLWVESYRWALYSEFVSVYDTAEERNALLRRAIEAHPVTPEEQFAVAELIARETSENWVEPSIAAQAVEYYRAYLALGRPEPYAVRLHLARCLYALSDYAGAIEQSKVAEDAGGVGGGLRCLALLRLGRVPEAVREAEADIAEDESAGAWLALALGRALLGDKAGAEEALQNTYRLEYPNWFVAFIWAQVHFHLGRYAEALEYYEQAVAEAPKAPPLTPEQVQLARQGAAQAERPGEHAPDNQ